MKSLSKKEQAEIVNETGKNLHQWFSELNEKGFDCIHWRKQIDTLAKEYELETEWAEYIAHSYCSECGLPWKERATNFEVSVSKTVNYPLESVMNLTRDWFDGETRAIPTDEINGHQMKYQWVTDDSEVALNLERKGSSKTRMVIRHDQLSSSVDAEIMRNFWKSHLKSMVESL